MLGIIIFICVFPAYWFTGILGQHRTLNVAYFFFILMWFINLYVWFNSINSIKKIGIPIKLNNRISILFIVGILFTGNGYNTLYDIFSGEASSYNIQAKGRHKTLERATKTQPREITFKPFKARPKSLFITDITKDPDFWINLGYNSYFRLDSTSVYLK